MISQRWSRSALVNQILSSILLPHAVLFPRDLLSITAKNVYSYLNIIMRDSSCIFFGDVFVLREDILYIPRKKRDIL